MLVSSRNSRCAASNRSSPDSTMPLGMVQAPTSRSFQYGPPGFAMNTSSLPCERLKSNSPALTFGRVDRGIARVGIEGRHTWLLRRFESRGKIAIDRYPRVTSCYVEGILNHRRARIHARGPAPNVRGRPGADRSRDDWTAPRRIAYALAGARDLPHAHRRDRAAADRIAGVQAGRRLDARP